MSRHPWWSVVALAALWAVGCGEEEFRTDVPPPSPAAADAGPTAADAGDLPAGSDVGSRNAALLRSVIQLVEEAALTPGGRNFDIATDYLNHYFAEMPPAEFAMRPEARTFLAEAKLPEKALTQLEVPAFTSKDARHIEDCLLYQSVAGRVAGAGDDLTRVRRVFAWLTRQVMLVPPESLGVPGSLPQAQARPYDVLVRGMATEANGYWTERSWVFMALCRQLGVDVGLVTITPDAPEIDADGKEAPAKTRNWLCGAAIGGKVYLFDARLGLEIPGPDPKAPATLDQVLAEPSRLDRLDLQGEGRPAYDVHGSDLSNAKLGIALDATLGYLSPRMRVLQRELAGKNRMVLHRDPADQRDAFASAFGDRFAGASLWLLPIEVEARLFTDPQFNQATGLPLQMFNPLLPLLGPRLMQLRGDLPAAIQGYVNMRYRPRPTLNDGKTPIPPEVQRAVDMHATYFLALGQLDQGNRSQAENLFQQTIKFLPEPLPGPPFYSLYHWGAASNLGRMAEEKGDADRAVSFYTRPYPTPQGQGDLVRAEALIAAHPEAAEAVFKPKPKPDPEKAETPDPARPAEEPPAEKEEKPPGVDPGGERGKVAPTGKGRL